MLEGLDKVDWDKLKHAYGKATDIPRYIENLRSNDSEILKKTFAHLYNCLYHQGTIYEASVATIPFMIDLLTEDNINRKPSIIRFLSHLSHGDYLKSYNLGIWDQAARSEVIKGFPIFLELLDDEDWQVQIQAVAILSYSPRFSKDKATLILDRLLNKLSVEEHELVISAILTGLGYIIAAYRSFDADVVNQVSSRIENIYSLESNPKIRLVALLSIPKILEEKTPQYVVDELLNIIENPPFPTTPANMGSPYLFALESLWHLDKIRCKKSLEIAIQNSRDSFKTLLMVSALMEWLYGGKGPDWPSCTLDVDNDGHRKYVYQFQPQLKSDKVSDFQIQVLWSIVNEDRLWQINQNLLERYGLPASREKLRQFVEKKSGTL